MLQLFSVSIYLLFSHLSYSFVLTTTTTTTTTRSYPLRDGSLIPLLRPVVVDVSSLSAASRQKQQRWRRTVLAEQTTSSSSTYSCNNETNNNDVVQQQLLPNTTTGANGGGSSTTTTTTTTTVLVPVAALDDDDVVVLVQNENNSRAVVAASMMALSSTINTTTTTMDATIMSATNNDDNNNSPLSLQQQQQQQQPKSPIRLWIERNILLGIDATPETLAIVTIYFVEGALGLARLAQSYLLKDELHLGPAELSAITGLFVLPWTIKPIYGFLSDGFPLFGYKRKSYLICAGIIGTMSYGVLSINELWNGLSTTAATSWTVVALLLSSACIAFSDVVADGIVVTRTRQSTDATTAGGLQSLCWGASAIGGLLSAYFSGSLLEVMSVRSIFGITAILPFLVALIALSMDEPRIVVKKDDDDKADTTTSTVIDGIKVQIYQLWSALQQPSIWKPALFIFLWQSTPTSDGGFFYFVTNDLQFGPEFLGRVRLLQAGAGLLGVWVYNQYLKTIKIKDILFWSTLASFPLGMLPVLLITHVNRDLGIPDGLLIMGDDVALAILGTVAFMPTLVLAARLCPPGVEAVLFATLMSIFNGASTVGTELGALLTKAVGITESNFDNLAWLTVFCNVSSLWPLILIGWLDGVGDHADDADSTSDVTEKNQSDTPPP